MFESFVSRFLIHCAISFFLSTFNASYMCPKIRCDEQKPKFFGTKRGLSLQLMHNLSSSGLVAVVAFFWAFFGWQNWLECTSMASFERYMKQGCCEKKEKVHEMRWLVFVCTIIQFFLLWSVGSLSWLCTQMKIFWPLLLQSQVQLPHVLFLLSLHGMASVFMMAMGIINISLPIRGELCRKATYNPTPIIPKEADR